MSAPSEEQPAPGDLIFISYPPGEGKQMLITGPEAGVRKILRTIPDTSSSVSDYLREFGLTLKTVRMDIVGRPWEIERLTES